MDHLYQLFKKSNQQYSEKKFTKAKHVFVKLNFDENGCFIEIINELNKITEFSYEDYNGSLRSLLRAIYKIQDRSDFFIDWENPETKIYLNQHDYLIEYLKLIDNLVDSKGKKVEFSNLNVKAELRAKINSENDNNWYSEIIVNVDGVDFKDFSMLNEMYILVDSKIYEHTEIGEAFNQIHNFNSSISAEDVSIYLSLLVSYIDNIKIVHKDYKVLVSSENIIANPCLIFEKIDSDQSLHIRVSQELVNTSASMLEELEITKYAEINELEQIIYVKNIERQQLSFLVDKVVRLIEKHSHKEKGKRKSEAQYVIDGNLLVLPTDIAEGFIYNELPNLLLEFKLYGSEKLKQYKISSIRPKLDLKLSHGIDFLEGDASISFGEEKFGLFDVIKQYQQNKYIQLSDGSHALINEDYIKKLERLFKKSKDNKVKLSFFDLPIIEDLIEDKIAEATFVKSKKFFEGFNDLKNSKPKYAKVKAKLREYQERGVQWMQYLHDNTLNGCLADDMGLGKTLQAITLLAGYYPAQKNPTLVVMPKSLLFNWQKELDRFSPNLTYYVYYAQNRKIEDAFQSNLILTTYAMMRNDIEKFKEKELFYVVLDESQNIKNTESQASKAVLLLNSKHRLALSGTPIENNLGELYSLFRFLNPAMFGMSDTFNKNYLMPIQKQNDTNAVLELRKKISPFILRRLKKDVLTELPDKIEQVLYIEMSDEQRKFYEMRRLFYKEQIDRQISEKGVENAQFFIFQAFNELRQIASIPEAKSQGKIESPKIESLIEQLSEATANGHKCLVFVNYLASLEKIGEELDNQGIDYVSMSGSTRDRQSLVDRFQSDPSCRVFLMTLKTGGTGLNLTAADMVFIFDPWWNKAAENQAIDRSHRIGQTQKVMAYKLITQGTIEEKIMQLQDKKAELFNTIISTDSASLKSFSEEDISFMLG